MIAYIAKITAQLHTKHIYLNYVQIEGKYLQGLQDCWLTNYLLPSDKHYLIMAKAIGFISLLVNISSFWDVPFCQLKYMNLMNLCIAAFISSLPHRWQFAEHLLWLQYETLWLPWLQECFSYNSWHAMQLKLLKTKHYDTYGVEELQCSSKINIICSYLFCKAVH